jgi:hypothetical protein
MVRSLLKISLLVSVVLLISITTPLNARAQSQRVIFTYAAKFVCGKGNEKLVSPGQYFTNINVHNPSPFNRTVYIKRFAIAFPEERPGPLLGAFGAILDPDVAMTIDCNNIYKHTQMQPGSFLEGFALIYSFTELDVASVYTAGHTEVEAFHTERVPVRRLVLPITTGVVRDLMRQQRQQ